MRAYQRSRLRHRGEVPDRLPVRTRHRPVDRLPLLGVEAAIPAGDGEAGHQPLDVPLERARQRLVEVVDAEHQPPVGRGEGTEVGQMRIAAELHVQPGPRRAGQIGRHRVGRAAEERERRHQHPPVADRHQLGHPRGGLLLQQLDRITPIGRPAPIRHAPERGAAALAALPLAARSSAVGWGTAFGLGCRPSRRRADRAEIRLRVVDRRWPTHPGLRGGAQCQP